MKILLLILLSVTAYAETVLSPNMSLPVPVVGTTTGPEWANDINSCMGVIDSHDHTSGKGAAITSAAININSDLELNNNSLTEIEAAIFNAQASFSTNKSLYVIEPDLYYNDGNGNVIQITSSGSVAGASGTITGLPSGTASASYQSVGGTFRFQSATNTPANINAASYVVQEQTASVTPTGVTVKVPSGLAASYNLTLPSAVPSYTSLLQMSTSGVLSTVPYKVPTIQTFTSGSGTYILPTAPSPIYIEVIMVGGGGGGSGDAGLGAGSAGGNTTFGSSLLTATGGGGAAAAGTPGTAGAATLNAPAIGYSFPGQKGQGDLGGGISTYFPGGNGGGTPFAPGGLGGTRENSGTGDSGITNSGAGGGGGASAGGTGVSGSGGGSGAFIDAYITSPSSTYAYAVGSSGAGGTNTTAGGSGAAGIIIVREYYQ